jgi:hypothetical protein
MHTVIQLYISQPESIGYTFCMSIFVKILQRRFLSFWIIYFFYWWYKWTLIVDKTGSETSLDLIADKTGSETSSSYLVAEKNGSETSSYLVADNDIIYILTIVRVTRVFTNIIEHIYAIGLKLRSQTNFKE